MVGGVGHGAGTVGDADGALTFVGTEHCGGAWMGVR